MFHDLIQHMYILYPSAFIRSISKANLAIARTCAKNKQTKKHPQKQTNKTEKQTNKQTNKKKTISVGNA